MPSIKIINQQVQTTGEISSATNGTAVSLDGARTCSAQVNVTVDTPAPKTFTDTDVSVADDTITIAANGYALGLKIRLTSTGTLPAGLATGTDYFVIPVTTGVFSLASSLANALAGTKINITDQGTAAATNTVTATAIAGATVKLQKSLDGTNWSDDVAATAIAATGVIWLDLQLGIVSAVYTRLVFAMTAGQMTVSSNICVKGPN